MTVTDKPMKSATPPWQQFSIRSLLLLTTFVAVLCSLATCTDWIVSAELGTTVLMAWIAGRIVANALVRNTLVCVVAIAISCALEYLYHRCDVVAIGQYDALLSWPILYFAIVWVNWDMFRKDRSPWGKWLGCILASALFLPLHALVIIMATLGFDDAVGIRILN